MGAFERKYSDEQREAVIAAYMRKIRPVTRIAQLAKRGELEHDGHPVAPFEMPVGTIYSLGRETSRKRLGFDQSALVRSPPATAVELLRRRLTSALDHETMLIERSIRAKPREAIDTLRVHRAIRAVRELAALPRQAAETPANTEKPTSRPSTSSTLAQQIAKAVETDKAPILADRPPLELADIGEPVGDLETPELSAREKLAAMGIQA